jgi:hypothetical protein
MARITYGEWCEARQVFRHFAMQEPHNSWLHFDAYTNVTFPEVSFYPSIFKFKVPDEAARRIEHMLGPNAYAMFKIYVARRK